MVNGAGGHWVLGFALLILCGCGEEKSAAFVAGDEDARAGRVVCGTPAMAEIVFALGCGERVVGVSEYTDYPPAAQSKPSIGGWMSPNRERLLALQPDLVITQGKHEALAAFAEEFGMRFHTVKLDSLRDFKAALASIGAVMGVEAEAAKLHAEIQAQLGEVKKSVEQLEPRRIALFLGRTPGSLTGLSTVGPGSFLTEIIHLAGGINVFADARTPYPQISKESLVLREPEVILEVHPTGLTAASIALLRLDWRQLQELPAVQTGRIHYLTQDYLLIPGPRVGLAAKVFAGAIHPEIMSQ